MSVHSPGPYIETPRHRVGGCGRIIPTGGLAHPLDAIGGVPGQSSSPGVWKSPLRPGSDNA
jgi:hypothetical protein